LVAMCGSESKAKREVMLARAWEAWRAWRRIGRSIAERVYYVLMLVLYLFVFPIALYVRWRKPSATRWQQAGLELSPLPAVPLLDPPSPAVPRSSQSLRY
jgi:dolichyl-phosphate-mannose--protein O-mannosyl transferase